jgi:hypothetical protein
MKVCLSNYLQYAQFKVIKVVDTGRHALRAFKCEPLVLTNKTQQEARKPVQLHCVLFLM